MPTLSRQSMPRESGEATYLRWSAVSRQNTTRSVRGGKSLVMVAFAVLPFIAQHTTKGLRPFPPIRQKLYRRRTDGGGRVTPGVTAPCIAHTPLVSQPHLNLSNQQISNSSNTQQTGRAKHTSQERHLPRSRPREIGLSKCLKKKDNKTIEFYFGNNMEL